MYSEARKDRERLQRLEAYGADYEGSGQDLAVRDRRVGGLQLPSLRWLTLCSRRGESQSGDHESGLPYSRSTLQIRIM